VRSLLGAALLCLAVAAPAAAQPANPTDDATRDPALAKVRNEALAAAKAKDTKKLLAHTDPRVQLNFGGDTGHAKFTQLLRREPSLWDELVWALENGGKIEKGIFSAPWTFSVNIGDRDPFSAAIAPGTEAPAHAQPNAGAPVLANIGRRVVTVTDWGKSPEQFGPFYKRTGWITIQLDDKRVAYVEAKHLRSSVDFRAGFEKKRGRWVMTFFLAGD
jgi:hypothetical protein